MWNRYLRGKRLQFNDDFLHFLRLTHELYRIIIAVAYRPYTGRI